MDACLKFTPELNLMVLQNFNFKMNNWPWSGQCCQCRPTRIQFQNEFDTRTIADEAAGFMSIYIHIYIYAQLFNIISIWLPFRC